MLSPTPISESARVVHRSQRGVHPSLAGTGAAVALPLAVLVVADSGRACDLGLALVAEFLAELAVDWPRRDWEPLRAV
jgi:hypothetical protein